MADRNTRATRSLIMALRGEGVAVVSTSPLFQQRCFGSLVRAARALQAWEAGDRALTVKKLDELFGYFDQQFPRDASPEECRRVLERRREGRLVVSEPVFPILITKYVLRNVRMDMTTVPSFAPWALRYERAVLAA